MLKKISKLSATAAMLLAVPAIANAGTIAYGAAAPVALSSYVVHESNTSEENGDGGVRPNYVVNGLTLDFVNTYDVAATGITFLLTDGKYTQRIVDRGTFAQGVSIVHTFAIEDGLSDPDSAVARVTDVEFADGEAWHAQVFKTVGSAPTAPSNATSEPMHAVDSPAAERNGAVTQRLFRHLGSSL